MYKLLIVDDEHIEREALKYVVSRECPHIQVVNTAINGQDAIMKVKQHRPNILFMDIKMPGISGLEAAKEIKSIDSRCQIIFISAFDYFHYAQKAIEVGAIDFILKPVSNEQLVESINRAINILEEKGKNTEQDSNSIKLESDLEDKRKESPIYPFEKEKKLCQCIVKDDEAGVFQYIDELLEWIVQTSFDSGEIKTKTYSLLVTINRAILQDTFDVHSSYYDRLQSAGTVDGLRLLAKKIVLEMKGELNLQQTDQTGILIEKTCDYINANYMKEIRLEEMAEMVNYSSHYFSKMFKLYKKQNFIDYVTSVRVAKAKDLLSSSQLTIREIGSLVGYEDQNYFTRVFKRMENMTPSEYRDKIVITP
jgi:two-component system, response regulator YesN